jgi:hypothetical protein
MFFGSISAMIRLIYSTLSFSEASCPRDIDRKKDAYKKEIGFNSGGCAKYNGFAAAWFLPAYSEAIARSGPFSSMFR